MCGRVHARIREFEDRPPIYGIPGIDRHQSGQRHLRKRGSRSSGLPSAPCRATALNHYLMLSPGVHKVSTHRRTTTRFVAVLLKSCFCEPPPTRFQPISRSSRRRKPAFREDPEKISDLASLPRAVVARRSNEAGQRTGRFNPRIPLSILDNPARTKTLGLIQKLKPKESAEPEQIQLKAELKELANDLEFDGSVQAELRFLDLDYELICELQSDDLVNRELTPQTKASIRIVLNTISNLLKSPPSE